MNATPPGRPAVPSAEMILQELTTRQFVRPHRPLAAAVADAGQQLGFREVIGAHAGAWLHLNPATAIGRLRRTELAQLAQSIRRFWCRAVVAKQPEGDAPGAAAHAPAGT